jgi:hypothetical protein
MKKKGGAAADAWARLEEMKFLFIAVSTVALRKNPKTILL